MMINVSQTNATARNLSSASTRFFVTHPSAAEMPCRLTGHTGMSQKLYFKGEYYTAKRTFDLDHVLYRDKLLFSNILALEHFGSFVQDKILFNDSNKKWWKVPKIAIMWWTMPSKHHNQNGSERTNFAFRIQLHLDGCERNWTKFYGRGRNTTPRHFSSRVAQTRYFIKG